MFRRYAILASSLSLAAVATWLAPYLRDDDSSTRALSAWFMASNPSRVPRSRVVQQWHQETSKSFALDEPCAAALVQRLDFKEVLAVENTRKHDAPEPSQLLVWHSPKDARAEYHALTADRLNKYLQRFTLPRRFFDAANVTDPALRSLSWPRRSALQSGPPCPATLSRRRRKPKG